METLMVSQRLYRVEMFTHSFKIEGKLEPMGEVVNALNDRRRNYMPVHEATVTPIPASNPLSPFTVPELIISKQDIVFVTLLDAADYEDMRLMANISILTVYTAHFVLRAEFHMGGEMRQRDFMDATTSDFIPVTKAQCFPLIPTKTALPDQRPFVVVNKQFVSMYHGEPTRGD